MRPDPVRVTAARDAAVRVTAAGTWFRPSDGGAGSLLRVADGVPAESVRRVRDVDVPGLLPIGNVVVERGGVWLRTPQPPGPTLADLLAGDPSTETWTSKTWTSNTWAPQTWAAETGVLRADDAVAVLDALCTVLRGLHSRGLCHGGLDADAVLLDPDGEPLLVMVQPGPGDPCSDAADVCDLAAALAQAWCDSAGAASLARCAELARSAGVEAARDALPPVVADPSRRRAAARAWDRAGLTGGAGRLPVDRPGADQRGSNASSRSGTVNGPR